eukprot:scaffold33648_cov51-Phaeocystis_antarctica.AAC.1
MGDSLGINPRYSKRRRLATRGDRRHASASGRRGSGQGGARCGTSKESHGGRGARAGRASEGGERRRFLMHHAT